MLPLLIIHSSPRCCYVISQELKKVSEVKVSLIPEFIHKHGFYLTCNSKIVQDEDTVEQGQVYHCVPVLIGGKGGFGSMLRAIGAQIEKTTSREACRDLSGRRMRDVNNEKKLKEWLSKQADREREREEKRQERLARRLAGVKHNFDDPTYVEQRSKVADDLEDALRTGLQRDQKAGPSATVTSSDIRGKRKAERKSHGKAKRQKEWLGLDIDPDDLSSEDSDEDSNLSSENGDKQRSSSHENSGNESAGDSSQEPSSSQAVHSDRKAVSSEMECEASTSSHSSDSVPGTSSAEASIVNSSSLAIGEAANDTSQGETTPRQKKANTLLSSLPPPKATTEGKEESKLEDVDLSDFSSAGELEQLGLERLKFALTERGLKCGGTLQQRAERLFSVKGLTRDQIDPSLFPKASGGKGKK